MTISVRPIARSHGEQLACPCDVGGAIAVGEQSVVADAVEALGQHVCQKTPNELAGRQRHGLIAVRPFDPVILPRERPSCAESQVRNRLSPGGSRIRTLGPGTTVDTVFLGLLGILPSAAGIRALGRLSIDFGSTPARRKTPAATAPFRPYPASAAR